MKKSDEKNPRFSFGIISSSQAQDFWNSAPGASVFTEPAVLERLCRRVDWLLARKGDVPVCLWPVCLPDGVVPAIPEFCYYIGPVWNLHGTQAPVHRWLADSTSVYQGFVRLMLPRYGKIRAQLPLGMHDVRVFDWWNYHEPRQPRFTIRPRYTACLRNVQSLGEDQLQGNLRNKRRQILRAILRQGVPPRSEIWETEELVELYQDVMGSRVNGIPAACLENIRALAALARQGRGEVVAFRDGGGEIMSAGMLLYGNGVANLVLCLTASKWRDEKITLWTMYSMILAGKARGMDTIDFNGANSPRRADDKHSYGAGAELFFELSYDEPAP
jgi:hypothetical protein